MAPDDAFIDGRAPQVDMTGLKLAALSLLAVLLGCHTFRDIDARRCGNGVREPSANEDCDAPIGRYRCGAPGSENACRLLCADDRTCPSGWACGVDGICRVASGRFEPARITNIPGDEMELADLDGDGLTDLVVQDRAILRYAYGEIDGGFSSEQVLTGPSTNIPLAVGDTDGDGLADVAQLFVDGLQVFRGTADRLLVPVSAVDVDGIDAPQRLIGAHVRPPYTAPDLLMAIADGDAVRFDLLDGGLDDGGLRIGGILVEIIAVGDLDGGGTADEIALAAQGDTEVQIVRVDCTPDCAVVPVAVVPMPTGQRVGLNGTHFGDYDGDGFTDLIVVADARGERAIIVARGGLDGFEPAVAVPALSSLAECVDCPGMLATLRTLTAVAHINSAYPTVATPFEIFDVTPDGGLESLYFPRRPLGFIRFADLNADGLPDAYGSLAGVLVYLLTNEARQFTQHDTGLDNYTVATPGDFDGDGYTDLAVALASGEVQVIFSDQRGPQVPMLVARLDEPVMSMGRARRLTPQHDQLDGADELVVFTATRRYVFQGSAERRPWAPIELPEFPRELAIGRFGPEARPAIYTAYSQRLMQQNQVLFGDEIETESFRGVTVNNCGPRLGATLNINRTVSYGGERNAVLTVEVINPMAMGTALAVRILALQGEIGRCVFNAEIDRGMPQGVAIGDIDGDGFDDLIIATRPMIGPGMQQIDSDPGITWWPGDGARFSDTPNFVPREAERAWMTGLTLGGQGHVVIGIDGDTLARLSLRDGTVMAETIGRAPDEIRQMRAGDINGDGVEDLVVKTAEGVFVYQQRPCSALDALDEACTRPPIE